MNDLKMNQMLMSWKQRRRCVAILIALLTAHATGTAATIQEQLDAAVRANASSVRIMPGAYRAQPATPRGAHVVFQEVTDLDVDASEVTLICENASPALKFERCRNVILRGLTIDYDPLPLTQGTIVGIAPDRTWTDVRVHEGYPEPVLHAPGQAFYWAYDGQTRLIKLGSTNRAVDAIEDRGKGVFRLDHGKRRYRDSAKPGDLIRMPQKFMAGHGIVQYACEHITLEDITLYSCPGFGISERGGSANVYRRVRIVPGPPPPGATEPRLFSSMFDGINCGHNRTGPVVEHCEFINTGDDGIAVYSPSAMVVQPAAGREVIVAPAAKSCVFQQGDPVRFYRYADTTVHDVKLVAVEPAALEPEAIRESVLKFNPGAARFQYRQAWRLTLDAPVKLAPGDMCENESQAGRGFRIENNIVRNTGSRGICVNQSGGVVRGNRVEHTFLPGIHMFAFMREGGAGFQEDVEIADNQIAWSCRAVPSRDDWCGAICITGWDDGFQTSLGHRNLRIVGNEIRSAVGLNIQIHCATAVIVRGNRFLDTHSLRVEPGRPRPVDNQAIVYLEQADNVQLLANPVGGPGPFAAAGRLLVKGPGTSNVTGTLRAVASTTPTTQPAASEGPEANN